MSNNIKAILIKIVNLTYRYMCGFFISMVLGCGALAIVQGTFHASLDLYGIFTASIFVGTVLFIATEILKAWGSLQNKMLIITNAALLASIFYLAEEFLISCIIYVPELFLLLTAFFVISGACVKHVLVERKDILVKDSFHAALYDRYIEPIDVYVKDLKHGL